jgi:hypothetical protein
MERPSQVWKTLIVVSSIGVLAWALQASAGVLLAVPEAPAPLRPDEDFPESRFGSPPSRLDANSDLGQSDSTRRSSPARRPAGLEFTDQTGQVKSTQIIPEVDMPSTPSNLNPQPSTRSRSGVQEIALIAGDLGYFPKTIFVTKNIPVRLYVTGASRKPLCMMMDSFQIRKQIRSQKVEEISFTPTTPGQFRFYCPVNGMEGTLLVKDILTGPEDGPNQNERRGD